MQTIPDRPMTRDEVSDRVFSMTRKSLQRELRLASKNATGDNFALRARLMEWFDSLHPESDVRYWTGREV